MSSGFEAAFARIHNSRVSEIRLNGLARVNRFDNRSRMRILVAGPGN